MYPLTCQSRPERTEIIIYSIPTIIQLKEVQDGAHKQTKLGTFLRSLATRSMAFAAASFMRLHAYFLCEHFLYTINSPFYTESHHELLYLIMHRSWMGFTPGLPAPLWICLGKGCSLQLVWTLEANTFWQAATFYITGAAHGRSGEIGSAMHAIHLFPLLWYLAFWGHLIFFCLIISGHFFGYLIDNFELLSCLILYSFTMFIIWYVTLFHFTIVLLFII